MDRARTDRRTRTCRRIHRRAIPLVRRYGITPEDLPRLAESRRRQALFLRRFVTYAAKVAAGSDSPNQLLAPGASLHEEMALLVRAGFTPEYAIQSATSVLASVLRADSIGLLRVGAVADLVIPAESPLENIRAFRRINAVVARGQRYDPASLRGR